MKIYKIFIIFISIICYTFLIINIFYYVLIPKIIERRARNLDLMQYSGTKNKFIAKDSLKISGWDLYYLQHGNMNGY